MALSNEQYAKLLESGGEIKGLLTGMTQRMDYQNGRLAKHDEKIAALEAKTADTSNRTSNLEKYDGKESSDKEKVKYWFWGAAEKILFILLGFIFTVVGLVLAKLGIINLQ